MKKCPFCSADLPDGASRCTACGGSPEKYADWQRMKEGAPAPERKEAGKWYFKTPAIIMGFLMVGPFVLPLVWFNPRYSRNTKFVVSAVVLGATYLLGALFFNSLKTISCYYQQMNVYDMNRL